jgi:ankyrin repeat protein
MHACKAQNLRLIQFLIQRMLKLNIPIDESNNNGDTALTIGIKTGNISVVKILLENHQISKLQPDKLLKVAHPSHKAIQEYLQHFFSRQSPKKQSSLPKNGDLLMR